MNKLIALLTGMILLAGCGPVGDGPGDFGPNPFLEAKSNGKEDTGYVNPRGAEVHVRLEGDVESSAYTKFDAPAEQAQFAVTHLRKRENFYLEILAEDVATPERVEWLVDGEWLDHPAAQAVDRNRLTHWRIREVNAVVLNSQANSIVEGAVFESPVPLKPYTIMADANDKCADHDSHISLGQSVYWYLWNARKSDCPAELKTTLNLTVEEVLPRNQESYPEYDRLWEDSTLTAAVFFAKLDDGDVADDYNWSNFNKLSDWLTEAGFTVDETATLGKRFVKQIGELTEIVDLYGPDVFHSVADWTRFQNWNRAVQEHEIVMYNGHSVLGTGMAFERAEYPAFYQIFQVASCLSYEYYVQPILQGKRDWASVDVLSNVEPTYYSENLPLTSTVLAELMDGFEHQGRNSWQDIMEAVSRRLGHYRFGVSGARENCWTQQGNRCENPDPDPDVLRYENTVSLDIPDNSPAGIQSTISVPDSVAVSELKIEIELAHTYTGDLKVQLSHNGVTATLWNREGGANDDIRGLLVPAEFEGMDAAGDWTLLVSDHASRDLGVLESWAVTFKPAGDPDPDPEETRFEAAPNLSIPDNDPSGVVSTLSVPASLTIRSIKVELHITHTYIGDLRVTLAHDGVVQTLWNQSGGSADDIREVFVVNGFEGRDAAGDWTLTVSDHASQDLGVLVGWALVVATGNPDPDPDPDPQVLRYESTTVVPIPDNTPAGVESVIEIPDAVGIAGLQVELEIEHTYVGDLLVVLEHDGTEYALHDRQGGGADDIRTTVDVTAFDGASASGAWKLKVADFAGLDTGSLVRWALVVTPAD